MRVASHANLGSVVAESWVPYHVRAYVVAHWPLSVGQRTGSPWGAVRLRHISRGPNPTARRIFAPPEGLSSRSGGGRHAVCSRIRVHRHRLAPRENAGGARVRAQHVAGGGEYAGAASVGHRDRHSAAAHELFSAQAPLPLSETPLLPTRASRRGSLDLTHPVFR